MKMVRTSICSIHEPEISIRDVYGIELKPEMFVAFNKSGTVRKGKIISVNRFEWKVCRDGPGKEKWRKLLFDISVEEFETNEISRIKNPNSLFVL